MARQDLDLVMVALGVLGDRPVNPAQPAHLVDGIHLRWTFRRERGFPWHGYYLLRRPHQEGELLCLSQSLQALTEGAFPDTVLNTSLGSLSSDRKLRFTDGFPSSGTVESALDDRGYLRFTFPPGNPARRVEVEVGFCEPHSPHRDCVDFTQRKPGRVPNPIHELGVEFTARDRKGRPEAEARFEIWSGDVGLDCRNELEIVLPSAATEVELSIAHFATRAVIEAYNEDGSKADVRRMEWGRETLRMRGEAISRLLIKSPQKQTLLHLLVVDPPEDSRPETVVEALLGGIPVARTVLAGKPGEIKKATLEFDSISAVEFSSGAAVVIDLCFVPVAQDITHGWEPLPDFPYPLCLPVDHPDYPCKGPDGGPIDARKEVRERVLYGDPDRWLGEGFGDFQEQLEKLVEDGPEATSMADRFQEVAAELPDPGVKSPTMRRQYPLDLLLLASLHPAMAQILGLYWVDQSAQPDMAYDYLLLGDHKNIFKGTLDDAFAFGLLLADVDSSVVFNKRMRRAPALPSPDRPKAYALPGASVRSGMRDATHQVGLRWDLGLDRCGVLGPGLPIMYHLWRADLGSRKPKPPSPRPDAYTLLNREAPVLIAAPNGPQGRSPERPADWPPFSLHTLDGGLSDGWFSYRIHGVDLFGRHGPMSKPARWHRWQPDEVSHRWAVHLLDKIPPPPPTAIEAFALDPEDPTVVRDDAYATWRDTLSAAERKTLIGLRVRWKWTEAQMRQAPDVREFRIYFHPGAELPAGNDSDHHVAKSWQERYYVVAYDDGEHFRLTTDNASQPPRQYEIFLPAAGDGFRGGLPIAPSLTEPIAYAHIGVSAADDKRHTRDHRRAGRWRRRFGNEGPLGAPAKIFRVWREIPEPPVPPPDSEKVFATRADYHGRSFYTYRWQSRPLLKTHVSRALDEALFQVDRTQARAELFDSDNVFPEEGRWDLAKRRQVAEELNGLRDEEGNAEAMAFYRELSNDALRVLAGLPGNEAAFSQITIQPLEPSVEAYEDTLPGRGSNRYFYRAAFVDRAHNQSPLSLASPPVYLPDVVPPRAPVWTKVLGGDRRITLQWASNRESDLDHYLVYRSGDVRTARDLRLMDLMVTLPKAEPDPRDRPGSVVWVDENVPGGSDFFYRVVAVDISGNPSPDSSIARARAFDESPPAPPVWQRVEWATLDADDEPGPFLGPTDPERSVVVLEWSSGAPQVSVLVQRRPAAEIAWALVTSWLREPTSFVDQEVDPATAYEYRLVAKNNLNKRSTSEISSLPIAASGGS